MARMLENLSAGTPVRCGDGVMAGDVRGVFSTGESRLAEYLEVFWSDRGESTLLPTEEVLSIDDNGVMLRSSRRAYDDLVSYDPASNPFLHRLE